MFVVADQLPVRLGRKGRFARSGKAEEEGDVARFPLVGGTVHRKDAVFRHQVVHDRENAFFHFAGVLGAENDKLAPFETERDARGRGDKLDRGVGGKLAGVENDVVRFSEMQELFGSRPDEHVRHEEGVVSAGADDAHLDPVFFIPPGVGVDDVEQIAGVEVVDRPAAVVKK